MPPAHKAPGWSYNIQDGLGFPAQEPDSQWDLGSGGSDTLEVRQCPDQHTQPGRGDGSGELPRAGGGHAEGRTPVMTGPQGPFQLEDPGILSMSQGGPF